MDGATELAIALAVVGGFVVLFWLAILWIAADADRINTAYMVEREKERRLVGKP